MKIGICIKNIDNTIKYKYRKDGIYELYSYCKWKIS